MILRLLLLLLRRVLVDDDEEEDDLEVIVLTPLFNTDPLPPHRASILPYIARVSIL